VTQAFIYITIVYIGHTLPAAAEFGPTFRGFISPTPANLNAGTRSTAADLKR